MQFKLLYQRLKNKPVRSVATLIFTFGSVLSIGFLGIVGSQLICSSIFFSVAVFVFSGAIEETVFAKSIYKGLGRLKLIGPNALRFFLKIELEHYLKSFPLTSEQDDFLQDYFKQRSYYKDLKKNFPHKTEAIIQAKKGLDELVDYFYDQMKKGGLRQSGYIGERLFKERENFLLRAKRKVWMLRGFFISSLCVGVASLFITVAGTSATLATLHIVLSLAAFSVVAWPLGLIAMGGAIFLFYKNISDSFKKETVLLVTLKKVRSFSYELPPVISSYSLKLYERLKSSAQFFCQSPWQATKSFVVKFLSPWQAIKSFGIKLFSALAVIALALAVIVLIVFLATATFFTSLSQAILGMNFIPGVSPTLVVVTCNFLLSINFFTDVTYGFSTSAVTIKALILALKNFWEKLTWENIKNFRDNKESFLQFVNPFRFVVNVINSLFQWSIFGFHIISVGMTTDRCLGLDPRLVAALCALAEGLQDASFFVGENDGPGEDDHHDHDHGGLAMFILTWLKNIVLIVLFVPFFDAFWHWVCKKKGDNVTFSESLRIAFYRVCGFHEHSHSTFEKAPPVPLAPTLSEAWTEKDRPAYMLSKTEQRLESSIINRQRAQEKIDCLAQIRSQREEIVVDGLKNGDSFPGLLSQTVEPIQQSVNTPPSPDQSFNPSVPHHAATAQNTPRVILNQPRTRTRPHTFFAEKVEPTTSGELTVGNFRQVSRYAHEKFRPL